jgi:hypothetical protein
MEFLSSGGEFLSARKSFQLEEVAPSKPKHPSRESSVERERFCLTHESLLRGARVFLPDSRVLLPGASVSRPTHESICLTRQSPSSVHGAIRSAVGAICEAHCTAPAATKAGAMLFRPTDCRTHTSFRNDVAGLWSIGCPGPNDGRTEYRP